MNVKILINGTVNVLFDVESITVKSGKHTINVPVQAGTVLTVEERRQKLSDDLNRFFGSVTYLASFQELVATVCDRLESLALPSPRAILLRSATPEPNGALRCYPLGDSLYLTVIWYAMPSGRYELTAYVN